MKLPFIITFCIFLLVACQPVSDDKQNLSTDLPACTKEGKICPNGQTVGRNPTLNCEFDPCPEPASAIECRQDMKQCPDGSFVIRDATKKCEFKACPKQSKQKEPAIFCTQDVAQCADGSYVGRDPSNNCEFKACPDGSKPGRSKTRLD